ncbi:hypothetical protein O5289_13255 [Klebsiella pneumoniae]|uniref:hypothetical protein n=1 Tax=Klebsiella pneumoniae TaxID=573 RepID=UPI0022B3D1D2|nr:hypothetical protein [Klebsiella pneumoniae]MCZ5928762.1 hypothetical protein [Klebsiella pneumoniae]
MAKELLNHPAGKPFAAAALQELQRICDALNHHHQPAARELAAAIWRLYCALSQLEQAPVAGTIGEGTT